MKILLSKLKLKLFLIGMISCANTHNAHSMFKKILPCLFSDEHQFSKSNSDSVKEIKLDYNNLKITKKRELNGTQKFCIMDNKIEIAYLEYEIFLQTYYINRLLVLSKHRGHKIGERLIRASINDAKENDCTIMSLVVHPIYTDKKLTTEEFRSKTKNIEALYESCGFKLIDSKSTMELDLAEIND